MTSSLRRLAVGGALVLVGALAGCSDSDSADAASTDDFCEAFNALVDKVLVTDDEDAEALVRAVKEWAADIEKIGTPEEMPDDAQHGFELFVDKAADLDEDMGLEDLQNLGTDLSEEDQADGKTFTEWTQDNCPLDLPG